MKVAVLPFGFAVALLLLLEVDVTCVTPPSVPLVPLVRVVSSPPPLLRQLFCPDCGVLVFALVVLRALHRPLEVPFVTGAGAIAAGFFLYFLVRSLKMIGFAHPKISGSSFGRLFLPMNSGS